MYDELITVSALRNCSDGMCSLCPYDDHEISTKGCTANLMHDAADAIEAAEQRISELERILKSVQKNSGINFRLWQEAEAQIPKEGEWVYNGNGTYSCNRCGSWIPNEQHYYARYCLFCGARMRGEHDE